MKLENFKRALNKLTNASWDDLVERAGSELHLKKTIANVRVCSDVIDSTFAWPPTEKPFWRKVCTSLYGVTDEVVEGWGTEPPAPTVEVVAYTLTGNYHNSVEVELKEEHRNLNNFDFMNLILENDPSIKYCNPVIRSDFGSDFVFTVEVKNPTEKMMFCQFMIPVRRSTRTR